jgi:hypothetical protein
MITDGGMLECLEKSLPQGHLFHQKPYTDYYDIEPVSPRYKTG